MTIHLTPDSRLQGQGINSGTALPIVFASLAADKRPLLFGGSSECSNYNNYKILVSGAMFISQVDHWSVLNVQLQNSNCTKNFRPQWLRVLGMTEARRAVESENAGTHDGRWAS